MRWYLDGSDVMQCSAAAVHGSVCLWFHGIGQREDGRGMSVHVRAMAKHGSSVQRSAVTDPMPKNRLAEAFDIKRILPRPVLFVNAWVSGFQGPEHDNKNEGNFFRKRINIYRIPSQFFLTSNGG